MAERAVFYARAVVYYFNAPSKTWAPTPVGNSFCRVDMYENTSNNTYRVIGRGLQDNTKIAINSNVTKDTQYARLSEIFHQWSDSRFIYGLNFGSKEEAETFGTGFEGVIQRLKGSGGASAAPPQAPSAPVVVKQQPIAPQPSQQAPQAPQAPPQAPPGPPEAPPGPPAPPPAPKVSSAAPERANLLGSITGFNKNGLKKAVTVDKSSPIVKGEKATSGGGGGGGGGPLDLMAQIQKKRGEIVSGPPGGSNPMKKSSAPPMAVSPARIDPSKSFKKTTAPPVQVNSGASSFGPISPQSKPSEATSSDLSAIKEEILSEMRRELQQMKEEILSAIQNR